MVVYGGNKKASGVGAEAPSFAGIVGQTELKRALLAAATDDALDGLLVRGEKGTAKSTAVRALAGLLPTQRAVADCPYGCPPADPDRQCADCRERSDPPVTERQVPLVTLPLGATRERVVGSLSVADALDGDPTFDPGLLARANRGILYVDEVNLLDDHLVDAVLDAAASGVNRVERDGVSRTHPADVTLVGTMNPEEGDLRPQLRDRFALSTSVSACADVDDRVRIVERALGTATPGEDDGDHAERLLAARDRLDDVEVPRAFLEQVATLCRDAGVDGHRADLAATRAARALAALEGRTKVIESDVRRGAELALPHRLRADPFDDAPDPDDLIDEHFDDEEPEPEPDDDPSEGDGDERSTEPDDDPSEGDGDEAQAPQGAPDADEAGGDGDATSGADDGSDADGRPAERPSGGPDEDDGRRGDADERSTEPGDDESGDDDADEEATPLVPGAARSPADDAAAPSFEAPEADDAGRSGGASASPDAAGTGPRVRTRRASGDRVDAAASVRAAGRRGAGSVESRDLRESVRASSAPALVTFVVDASASMRPAMRAAKGTVLALLREAYEARDEVAFVAFAGEDAEVLLPPTDSVSMAARHLKQLPTGDRTPLPDGLRTAHRVVERADPAASVVVLVTDGRANVAAESPTAETRSAARALAETGSRVVVVDASDGARGLVGVVRDATGGERVPLSALSAERVGDALAAARE